MAAAMEICFLDIYVVAARKALLKLIDVLKHLLLSAFYTIYTIKMPQRIDPARITRSSANVNAISFRQRKCRTATFDRSFFPRITRTWNSLPERNIYD